MYYNTVNFGIAIRDVRKRLKMTQKEVAEITGINENTMRRMENGKVLPRQETLDLLSVAYKQDISHVFLACRMDGFGEYTALMEEIERAFEASNPLQLRDCLSNLLELSDSDMSLFYKNLLHQTVCLIEGAIAIIEQSDYDLSYEHLLKGLQITIDQFDYQSYQDHIYNKLELQLLMNLSTVENERKNCSIALDLIEFCATCLNNEPELKKGILPTKIYLNASYLNHLNDRYENSLQYAEQGITYNITSRSQYAIGHLYARKGFAELNLKSPEHIESFKKALFYHDVLGQVELKEMLVRVLKERKGIDILNL